MKHLSGMFVKAALGAMATLAPIGPAKAQMTARPIVIYFQNEVVVALDLKNVEKPPPQDATVLAELSADGGETILRKWTAKLEPEVGMAEVALDAKGLAPGRYTVRISVLDSRKKELMDCEPAEFEWPTEFEWPGASRTAKTLNNMVVVLLDFGEAADVPPQAAFTNPREGWVFFSLKAKEEAVLALKTAAGEEILCSGTQRGVQEAMRFLPEGEHSLRIRGGSAAGIEGLTVRAVPETAFCYYPDLYPEYCPPLGPKNEAFLRKNIFPNINCIVSSNYGQRPSRVFLKKWKESGRWWIARRGGGSSAAMSKYSPEEVRDFMLREDGAFNDPRADAFIVDELVYHPFPGWVEEFGRLGKEYPQKRLYVFGHSFEPFESGQNLMRAIAGTGGRVSWERYLCEMSSRPAARVLVADYMPDFMHRWKSVPGFDFNRNFTINLGLVFSLLGLESVDLNPAVDFKVFCDLQMNALANDPACRRLGGVMLYHIRYAQEEHIDWAGKLLRHYCIEGKTGLLSAEYGLKYRPGHIRNPDFTEGTSGWTLEPAEEGSIDVREVPGYGAIQGRYQSHGGYHKYAPSKAIGDKFLCMTRSDIKPNVISQEIRGLEPGKLYSAKMITADYAAVSTGYRRYALYRISMKISGAELIPEKSFQAPIRNNFGRPASQGDIWMNLHRQVFRAESTTARLTISDWASPVDVGGAPREMTYNHIEVQRFMDK